MSVFSLCGRRRQGYYGLGMGFMGSLGLDEDFPTQLLEARYMEQRVTTFFGNDEEHVLPHFLHNFDHGFLLFQICMHLKTNDDGQIAGLECSVSDSLGNLTKSTAGGQPGPVAN